MIENLRTETMNLPASSLPAFSGKTLISAIIVASLATIVIVRAAAMPQAANDPEQPAQLSSAGADCGKHVWPYVTSGCLQGAPSSENVRVVVGKPPPDAQTQAREADALYNAAMRPQKRTRMHPQREHDGELIRERRARRNATFF